MMADTDPVEFGRGLSGTELADCIEELNAVVQTMKGGGRV
jgi:hypothetical protein